jgi:2-(1,2-epoxy-1,2-dihydrophenyl)acetyl-CoA isomerase
MAYETLDLTVTDGIARLRLTQPGSANAIGLTMARELHAAVADLQSRADVRVVLISAEGRLFCGGGDVASFATQEDVPAFLREITASLHVAVSGLARLDAPVVAAVQGPAAGAGMGLVGVADLVVAAESAKFVLAYAGIGLSPDGGSSWFLPRMVGTRRALEMALLNRTLTAAEALDWGIVTAVVPDERLAEEAEALAARLASGPTVALAAAKRLLREAGTSTLESHMALERQLIAECGGTADGREGIAAFLAKRAPGFVGG